jgi:hypothetical protein
MASINQYTGAIPDQITQRNLVALLQSILSDMTLIKTNFNLHQHSALNAVPSVGIIGNLNTTT